MKKNVTISALVISIVAAIIATFMLTFTFTSFMYEGRIRDEFKDAVGFNDEKYKEYKKLAEIIADKSIYKIDADTVFDSMMKGYIAGIGDDYAAYMPAEEYAAWLSDNTGIFYGIGVNIFASEYNGNLYIEVFNIAKNSPAEKAGMQIGDVIYEIITADGKKDIAEIGYMEAINLIKGDRDTDVSFTVVRSGDFSNPVTITATRGSFIGQTVISHISTTDSSIGVVDILGFDVHTPLQFSEAVDALKSQGINKFVFDVRDNPGGDLKSIKAVLSYFLNKDDIVVRTIDNKDNWIIDKVEVVKYAGDYEACSVTKEDIGKYRELDFVVLVNERTASAAELFTSALMDYKLAEVIGMQTFGKGSMQEIFNLGYYGLSGGMKLTTKMYYPPISENYNGIGIAPDTVVEMNKENNEVSRYKLTEIQDNQLQAAINAVK